MKQSEWLRKETEQIKIGNFKARHLGIGKMRFAILFAICLCFGLITFLHCKDDFGAVVYIENEWKAWTCDRCGFRNYEGIERCAVCGTERA